MTQTPLLLSLLALALAGCAASSPSPEPPRTLAEVDALAKGHTAEVVLLSGETLVLERILLVGPDSLRGWTDPTQPLLAVDLQEVDRIEIEGEGPPSVQGAVCTLIGAVPGTVMAVLLPARLDASSYVSEGECRSYGLGVAAAGAACGAFAGSRVPPPPAVVRIAPLSQFEDAPREGVGLRE